MTGARVPVTVIGGFLGAGKTSLLNHVLSGDHGVRAAVLVNDFGAINIDAKLVVGVEGETISLENGCVCCSIRDDLAKACLGLLQRPEPPEHVLIELSGVSDPIPVMDTFLESDLRALFSLSGALCVVDAEQFPQLQGAMAAMAAVQVASADIVAINKIDLVDSRGRSAVRKRIHDMASGSRIVEVNQGRVPLELIFEHASRHDVAAQGRSTSASSHAFATWHWSSERPLSLPSLRSTLASLPDGVYRAKGILHLEEMPRVRYVLQMVGRRYGIEESGGWDDEPPGTEIVLIGAPDGIDAADLQRAFDEAIGSGDESQSPLLRLARKLVPVSPSTEKR